MRLPGPPSRCLTAAVLLFAGALALAPTAAAQPVATRAAAVEEAAPLSAYDRFELLAPALATDLLGPDGNERARRELGMHLEHRLGPWLARRNDEPRGQPPRALRIEPTIVELSYVDPAVRYAVGPVAGPEQLKVRVRFIDAETGARVAEIELRAEGSAVAGVAPLGATSAELPRRIAESLAEYLEAGAPGRKAQATTRAP
jgi:hypothetical protein